jgi:DNA-directed RNA polymerase subunit RPC12/RpoP
MDENAGRVQDVAPGVRQVFYTQPNGSTVYLFQYVCATCGTWFETAMRPQDQAPSERRCVKCQLAHQGRRIR